MFSMSRATFHLIKIKVIERFFIRVIFSGRFILQTFLNTWWAYLIQMSDTGSPEPLVYFSFDLNGTFFHCIRLWKIFHYYAKGFDVALFQRYKEWKRTNVTTPNFSILLRPRMLLSSTLLYQTHKCVKQNLYPNSFQFNLWVSLMCL